MTYLAKQQKKIEMDRYNYFITNKENFMILHGLETLKTGKINWFSLNYYVESLLYS